MKLNLSKSKKDWRSLKIKKIFLYGFSLLIFFILILIIFTNEYFEQDNFKLLFQYYEDLKLKVDQNILLYISIYFFFSILWICLVGIVTPMLVISTLLFGYVSCIFSIISFTIGSTISFFLAKKLKGSINFNLKKINIKNNAFFLFIIFRFIPGIPFMIKNFSGVFFNLNNKEFIAATILAESPQIILFVFILNKLIKSSEILITNFDLSILYNELLIPILLIISFLVFIFIIKIKFQKYFYKN